MLRSKVSPLSRQLGYSTRFVPRRTFASPATKPLFQSSFKYTFEKPFATKFVTLTSLTAASTTPFLFKQPVHCEAAYATKPAPVVQPIEANKPIFRKGELTFGTFFGICTGILIKKVGKMFAFCVGTCYVFLQYLANLGYVTIHWDRVEQKYNRHMDVDKDGKVTNRDVQSKWNTLIAVLTNNIQFKSTFLAGFYVGLRYS